MPATTRNASKKAVKEPMRPALQKIKLTRQEIDSAIWRPATEEERTAIEKVAVLEAELRKKRETELQEALTPPTTTHQVPTDGPLLESPVCDTEDQPSH